MCIRDRAVAGRLAIARRQQIKRADNAINAEVKMTVDQLRQLVRRQTGSPKSCLLYTSWVSAADHEAVHDGNLVTATTWMAHPEILRQFISLIGSNTIS